MQPNDHTEHQHHCARHGHAHEGGAPPPAAGTGAGGVYTCPMHPDVVRDAPGDCPACGMALEPRTVSVEEENPELIDMTRRYPPAAPLAALALAKLMHHRAPKAAPIKTVSPESSLHRAPQPEHACSPAA